MAQRLRDAAVPALHAALAATLAWLFARRVLGDPAPFFAPIAAAVSLSISHLQRSQRALQLMLGVTLGIAIGEGLQQAFGDGALVIGLAVLVCGATSALIGWGFIGQGMMFVNQMMVSAILVIALHRAGTGSERILDALTGGMMAVLVGTLLFPAAPLPLLEASVRGLLGTLAGALREAGELIMGDHPADPMWTLSTGHQIHMRLADLAGARAAAKRVARIAPRRWSQRGAVAGAEERAADLDLLANSTLSVVRSLGSLMEQGEPLPEAVGLAAEALADAYDRAADGRTADALTLAREAFARAGSPGPQAGPQGRLAATLIRAAARDLGRFIAEDVSDPAEVPAGAAAS